MSAGRLVGIIVACTPCTPQGRLCRLGGLLITNQTSNLRLGSPQNQSQPSYHSLLCCAVPSFLSLAHPYSVNIFSHRFYTAFIIPLSLVKSKAFESLKHNKTPRAPDQPHLPGDKKRYNKRSLHDRYISAI